MTRISNGAIERERKARAFEEYQEFADRRNSISKPQIITNRMKTRASNKRTSEEAWRLAQRSQRVVALKNEAAKIRKRFRKNYKNQERWKEIELEIIKLLGTKGGTNKTKPKKKR